MVADIGSANFSYKEKECGAIKVDNSKVSVSATYLNPGDELIAKVLLTEKPESIESTFRQPEVKFISRDSYDPAAPDVLTRALFEAIQRNFILHAYMKLVFPAYSRYLEFEKKTKKNT